MKFISSESNDLIKKVKSLKLKKYRELRKIFFVEGARIVKEALVSSAEIKEIIISEKASENEDIAETICMANKLGCDIYTVSETVFKSISETTNPQGILATIKMADYDLEEMIIAKSIDVCKCDKYFVILDEIKDPGNMGTIIRTADAAGFNGVIVSKGCVDVYNSKVLRSTMGSIFHIPINLSQDLSYALKEIKSKNIRVYAAHTKGNLYYYEADMTQSTAIVIGNEAFGISDKTMELADELISIPITGRAESLNASVAAGILMYEPLRQKKLCK